MTAGEPSAPYYPDCPEEHLHTHLRPIRDKELTCSQLQGDRQELPPVTQWLSNSLYGWLALRGLPLGSCDRKYQRFSLNVSLMIRLFCVRGPDVTSNQAPQITSSHLLLINCHLCLFQVIFIQVFKLLAHLFYPTVPGHIRTCSVLLFGGGRVFSAQPEL